MAGTPCGRLICDATGPRPKYLGKKLDLPDILVFTAPQHGRHKRFQVVPSYLTKDPKLVGKTRHHQAMDILNESDSKAKKHLGDSSITSDLTEIISAGSVQSGEPKTQSCTVNNSEGNQNAGQEGQMVEELREEFMAVWAYMVETGQDKTLRETIERKLNQTIAVFMKKNGVFDPNQEWAITVFGLHDYC